MVLLGYNNAYQRDTLKKVFNMASVNDFVKGGKKFAMQGAVFNLVDALNKAGAGLPVPQNEANTPVR